MATKIGSCVGVVAGIILVNLILAFLLSILWDSVLVGIFPTLPRIDLWAAWGILIILSIIGSALGRVYDNTAYRGGR